MGIIWKNVTRNWLCQNSSHLKFITPGYTHTRSRARMHTHTHSQTRTHIHTRISGLEKELTVQNVDITNHSPRTPLLQKWQRADSPFTNTRFVFCRFFSVFFCFFFYNDEFFKPSQDRLTVLFRFSLRCYFALLFRGKSTTERVSSTTGRLEVSMLLKILTNWQRISLYINRLRH